MPTLTLKARFRVDLVVQGKQHFYDVFADGAEVRMHRFPGVTGALSVINKPALVPWASREALKHVEAALWDWKDRTNNVGDAIDEKWIANVIATAKARPNQIKDSAADLGTLVHAYIDRIIRGGEYLGDVPEELAPAVAAFKKWWKQSGIEIVLGDTKVASLKHKFGGSLDALGKRNGKFIILDWKTSNGIYDEYALQVAAYAQAFHETYGVHAAEAIVVRFSKKLPIEFEAREVLDLDHSLGAFLAAKQLRTALDLPHFAVAVAEEE